jgi:hypothetical protein
VQTLLAFAVFPNSETMSPMKFAGTLLVIGCSAYYAYVRKAEMKQKMAPAVAAKEEEGQPVLASFPATPDDNKDSD